MLFETVTYSHVRATFAFAFALATSAIAIPAAAATGGYSPTQAAAGATVFAANCATCHAANLSGGSGPALTGASFHASLQSNYKTAAQLYDFIRKQMPLSAPGSLSASNYLAVTAYVIKSNGFEATKNALTAASAPSIKLAGVTMNENGSSASSGQADEIVRAAPPTTVSFGPMPAGADVNVTDAMLAGAASDPNDWLLGGKTYANDRYSTLDKIDTTNIATLTPVAIVQTGMTASFETTPVVVDGVMYVSTPVVGHQMKIMALDATTGARIWETTWNLGAFKICCGPVNRGVAVAYGNVYFVTLDDKLVALDAMTGKPVFTSTVANASVGYSETMTPQVYKHQVIVGSAGGEWAIRGFVASYDAMTGSKSGAGIRRIPTRLPARRTRAAAAWCGRRRPSTPRITSWCSARVIRIRTSTVRIGRATTSTRIRSSASTSRPANSVGRIKK